MYCAASARAASLRARLTASSRSRIRASAPVAAPLPSFFSSSAGTNSSERMGSSLGTFAHHGLPPAFGDQFAALVEGLVQEFDDAGIGPRAGLALGGHLGGDVERVAVEHGLGEPHLGHAEVADGGAERGFVDRDADHQPQSEQAVNERL